MKTRFVSITLFCLLLFLAIPAAAKDTWVGVRSKNFNLIGNAAEKDVRAVAARLEQFREALSLLFPGIKLSNSIPTNVIVFKNDSSYNPFRPKLTNGKPNTEITGYFHSDREVNYITVITEGEKKDTYENIFHNYVHYVIDTNFGKADVPPWFTEGLAEYYQAIQIKEGQRATLGTVQLYNQMVLQNNRLQPLRSFFDVSNYSLSKTGNNPGRIFLAQSWALMHYLLQDKSGAGKAGIGKFVSLLTKKVPQEQAFKEAFGYDYAAMEKALEKYVAQNNYAASPVTLNASFDAGMTAAPVSDAQANAYLGDLLYRSNELLDAEKYLQAALSLDANSSLANASLGLLRIKQHKFNEAVGYAEKAVATGREDYFVYYNFAYVLSRENTDEFNYVSKFSPEKVNQMRAALKKAIELNPDFAEGYRLLGFLYVVNDDNPEEALAYVNKGLALQPGNQEYPMLLAQIYLRQKKTVEAREIAQRLLRTAYEPHIRNNAQNILNNIDRLETFNAANETGPKTPDITTGNRPALNKREPLPSPPSLTRDEISRIQSEYPNISMNKQLEPLKAGETRAVGYIQKVACVRGEVIYTFKTETETLTLRTKDFANLKLLALTSDVADIEFGCNAQLENVLAVINYQAGKDAKANSTLLAVAFVPKTFKLKTAEEIAKSEKMVVEMPDPPPPARTELPQDKKAEFEARVKEETSRRQADFDAQRREALMAQVRAALRKPQDDEKQMLGTIQKIECVKGKIVFHVQADPQLLKFRTLSLNDIKIMMLSSEYTNVHIGCGVNLPPMLAVITYVPDPSPKSKETGILVAVEFVPRTFTLP